MSLAIFWGFVYQVSGKTYCWNVFDSIWQNFIILAGQILKKCSDYLVTMSWTHIPVSHVRIPQGPFRLKNNRFSIILAEFRAKKHPPLSLSLYLPIATSRNCLSIIFSFAFPETELGKSVQRFECGWGVGATERLCWQRGMPKLIGR